tara:strand:+ start:1375 stop:2262 length:888 start_codon:yes stop_codon:yes gene_type:complete
MGLLGSIASLGSALAPVLIPGAGGAVAGLASGIVASGEAKNKYRKQQQAQAKERENIMINYPSGFDPVTGIVNQPKATTKNAGFGSGFGQFLGEATTNILGPLGTFATGISSLFGGGRPTSSIQQPAITSVTNVGAKESQGSGSIQAGIGSLVPSLVGGLRSVITSPTGQIGIGTALGGALSLLDSTGKQVRVTRKTKRLAQQAYQLSFGDLSSATQLFAQLSGIAVNEMQFVMILTKRFRNDGPVITKAAVRKTRSTLRKMKNMCDMYNSVAKAPARRRASPMKRASSTTLIKN